MLILDISKIYHRLYQVTASHMIILGTPSPGALFEGCALVLLYNNIYAWLVIAFVH